MTKQEVRHQSSKIVSDLADAYLLGVSQANEHYTYAYNKDFVRLAIYHVNAQIEELKAAEMRVFDAPEDMRDPSSYYLANRIKQLEEIKSELESRIENK